MPIPTEKLTRRFLVIITIDANTACCMFPQALNCIEFGRINNSNNNNNINNNNNDKSNNNNSNNSISNNNNNIIMLLLC